MSCASPLALIIALLKGASSSGIASINVLKIPNRVKIQPKLRGTMAFKWIRRWLKQLLDRRACPRIVTPLVAHYWDGGAPQGHPVKNISAKGAYILTSTRWHPGTIVNMTFQYNPHSRKVAGIAGDPNSALLFRATVVRFGPDGVGVQFVYLSKQERERFEKFYGRGSRSYPAQGICRPAR